MNNLDAENEIKTHKCEKFKIKSEKCNIQYAEKREQRTCLILKMRGHGSKKSKQKTEYTIYTERHLTIKQLAIGEPL